MFQIRKDGSGNVILAGILDGSQTDEARRVLETVTGSCDIDFRDLAFISSAGLGLLIATQKRLAATGAKVRLIHMPPHLRKVFDIMMFSTLFEIT